MKLKPRVSQRKPRFWAWRAVRQMYLQQFPTMLEPDLEQLSREVTRQLNNLDNRTRYNEWLFNVHERPSGLNVGQLDDPTEWVQGCA